MTLKARILTLVSVLISALIALVVILAVQFVKGDKFDSLTLRAQRTADLQAAALAQPIWDMEDERQSVLLEALTTDQDLLYAAILSDSGEATASVGRKPLADDDVLNASQVIRYEGDGDAIGVGSLTLSFSKARLEEQASALAKYGIIAALVILAVILGLVHIALGLFTKPLAKITGTMDTLVAGDLSVDIPSTERKDEIGNMARSVLVFKDNAVENQRLQKVAEKAAEQEAQAKARAEERRQKALEDEKLELEAAERRRLENEAARKKAMQDLAVAFEQSTQGIIEQVASTTNTLQKEAVHLSEISGEGVEKVAGGDAAVTEASSNTSTIAASTEEMSSSISEITRQISLSSEGAREAVDKGSSAQTQMQELSEKAAAINGVLAMIQGISEQTNLLALNATIEAARAGDAGRGFSVVASEVKDLATQTAKATAEIQAQVEEMQGSTNEAVSSISAVVDTVNKVGDMVASIAAAVEEQDAATNEIARSARLASDSAVVARESISALTTTVEETGDLSQSLNNVASGLADQTHLLQKATGSFLEGIRG